jgi:hypothetical protein
MEPKYPFRPFIGPGVTTITGDRNNPFGGTVTSQNTNMVMPNESPEQTIMRLSRSGLAVDQIAQLTGLPQDQIAMQVSLMQGQRPTVPTQQPEGIGIESLMEDNESPELSNYVEQGGSISDLIQTNIDPNLPPTSILTEGAIALGLEDMNLDLSEEEAEALDAENDPEKKVIMASAAGASSRGAEDKDALDTFQAMTDISATLDPKERLKVYKDAAAQFYNVDDIKELITKPDEGLPFLVAGAALIQAGEKGESWGTALSTALSKYAVSKRKGERDYEKTLTSLDIQRKQNIDNFALQMYLADVKDQRALSRSLMTADRQPYKVGNNANPEYLTDSEVAIRTRGGEAILPWRAEDGNVKEYTLFVDENKDGQPDNNAAARTELLSVVGAQNKQAEGFIVREGNLTKGKKLYMVNGKSMMMSETELEGFLEENPQAQPLIVGTASVKEVIEKSTGLPTFVSAQELMSPRGRELYAPVGEENMVVLGPNGEPILIKGDGSALTASLAGKERKRVQQFLIQNDTSRNQVIKTRQSIVDLFNEAERKGAALTFGTAGGLTTLGKRFIDEVDQLKTVFTDPKQGYNLYTDANGNGVLDPGEEKQSFEKYSKQFDEKITNSNLGKFLLNSGLSRKRVNSLVLTLALQSAATDNQKSRDISDKDMERWLTRAGAYATSPTEFLTLIDDLTLSVMNKHEIALDNELKYALGTPGPDGTKISFIEEQFGDVKAKDSESRPFRDAPYTIAELKAELSSSPNAYRDADYIDPKIDATSVTVLPGGNEPSGVGKRSVHDIYVEYETAGDNDQKMGYLSELRKELGQNSPEFMAIKAYIQQQLAK